jgi:hypothetical protein
MAIRTITATNVKLISITDLRPIDFQSGKRLAIPAAECNVCDRCEKLHVKVYEIEADGLFYSIGSGCCKRMFGWEPAKMDVQEKERRAEETAVKVALQKAAQGFIDQINAIPVPTPTFKRIQQCLEGPCYVYHADGLVIGSKIGMISLDAEKLAEFARDWREMKLNEALKEYGAIYKANRADARRAKQLVETVKKIAA